MASPVSVTRFTFTRWRVLLAGEDGAALLPATLRSADLCPPCFPPCELLRGAPSRVIFWSPPVFRVVWSAVFPVAVSPAAFPPASFSVLLGGERRCSPRSGTLGFAGVVFGLAPRAPASGEALRRVVEKFFRPDDPLMCPDSRTRSGTGEVSPPDTRSFRKVPADSTASAKELRNAVIAVERRDGGSHAL